METLEQKKKRGFGHDLFGMFDSQYMRPDGTPCERTPQTHPYSYETFVQWRNPSVQYVKGTHNNAYSDRMYTWDHEKFDRSHERVFKNKGQFFGSSQPHEIEAFLRFYYDNPALVLTDVYQCCNQSSGYPLWFFRWNDK